MATQKPSKPLSAAEMIDVVGIEAVCNAFGKTKSTVTGWRSRNVPKKYHDQLARMVEEGRRAESGPDTGADEIDAFSDALTSIGKDLASLSEGSGPSAVSRNPSQAFEPSNDVPPPSLIDDPAGNDLRSGEDGQSGNDVDEREVVSPRHQRRLRRARRQREAANGQQIEHSSRAATAPIGPTVDHGEDASSPAVAPAAVEHTKKPVRLNRQTVILAGAALVAATGIGLSQGLQSVADGPTELAVEETRSVEPQASVVLPSFDYATVTKPPEPPKVETVALTAPAEPPKLEEPVPQPVAPVVTTSQPSSPAPRRDTKTDEEEEAALQSGLFPPGAPTSAPTSTPAAAGATDGQNGTLAALDRIRQSLGTGQGVLPQGQGQAGNQQESFLTAQLDDSIYLKNGLHKPLSEFEVKAGTVIPAALITGLNSDLPGEVIGQVTEHVYDTATGQHLLIPQGAKILGRYNSEVGYAQNRAQVVWDRLIMPNGNSVQLEAMVGTDKAGYAGLADQVDHHFGTLLGAVILSSFISVGANLATDSGGDVTDALGDAAAQQAAEIGSEIVGRQLEVQPTITVRPGFKLNILVNKDMILEAYPAG